MTQLLVGTRKGLFTLEGEPGGPFEVAARAFAGETVEYALRDPRTGRLLASVTSGHYGPRIWYSDDANHIPVQMRAKMFWGTLNFKLQRIEQSAK